jgi:hypothetical protein
MGHIQFSGGRPEDEKTLMAPKRKVLVSCYESGECSTVQELLVLSMLDKSGELLEFLNEDRTYGISVWWIYSNSKVRVKVR